MMGSVSSPNAVSIDSGELSLSALGDSVRELEQGIVACRKSQHDLNQNITSMSQFLHDLNESEEPYEIGGHVAKLHDAKRRVRNVHEILGSVHDRLSRLQRQIAREVFQAKKSIVGAEVPTAPAN